MIKLHRLPVTALLLANLALSAQTQADADPAAHPEQRQALFGDLHLHTAYSFDAYVLMGTRVDPETAYRFARGDTVDYLGEPIRRNRALDFLAVTDHAENIGYFTQLEDPDSELANSEFGRGIAEKLKNNQGMAALKEIGKYQFAGKALPGPDPKAIGKATWRREIDIANRYYNPGTFTTFIAYEWTAMLDGANLHRNVIFRGDDAPIPFTSADSINPEDLWNYLETIRPQGYEALAIPHNANASNGLMFDWNTQDGKPIDEAYAQRRAFNEPLNEIAQNKGTSETHPMLSPDDEFADFELFNMMLTLPPREGKVHGSYLREALGRGLELERKIGVNPYKFGFIGSSDLHSGLSASREQDYGGSPSIMNMGGGRATAEQAKAVLLPGGGIDTHTGAAPTIASSGTLTGVWAEHNTRESIYDAFRRKEVFATSGTRLQLRFFGGWDFADNLTTEEHWVESAYNRGVAMGGDLPAHPAGNDAPAFAVWAVKDPDSGNLDRAQIVKVWLDNGEFREKVYDVAWSGKRTPDADSGKLPPVGNSVDLKTGTYSNDIGATALRTTWRDPDFHSDQPAVYYLRVLEIPTPRWSTLLAIRSGLPLPGDVDATIQERGWSSPIWYTPDSL